MLFPTVDFGLFFILAFAGSWVLTRWHRAHKSFLLAASYLFYGFADWRFCGLLAFNAVSNYAAGRLIDASASPRARRFFLQAAVFLNLGVLALFKYLNWFLESWSDVLFFFGFERDVPLFDIILPVGISFYTFQGISYVADIYRREIEAERSLFDVALYISFFPQLVAGPIVRASAFLPQLKRPPSFSAQQAGFGMTLIVAGLFKKMIVANYLATLYVDDAFFDPGSRASLDLLLAAYGYGVQIYCDFSGYSDIAIGVAALLGYRFLTNFNQPYRAMGVRDFWRRWHISLSTWLRDYLYIPLGGSRRGEATTLRNLFLTMLLGGIWHGAAWTFVIWGALHGAALAAERFFAGQGARLHSGLRVFLTFHFVCFAWIFFRCETLDGAFLYLRQLSKLTYEGAHIPPFILVLVGTVLAFQFMPSGRIERVGERLGATGAAMRAFFFAAGLLAIQWMAPDGVAPFIYFRF